MKIGVTGGAGYIGGMLVRELLRRGHDVTCFDTFWFGMESVQRTGAALVEEDIRCLGPEDLKGLDCMMDLASISNDPSAELDPEMTMSINHRGRVRVARFSREAGVRRYILASTCSVYGVSEETATEGSLKAPITTYAKASALAEDDTLALSTEQFAVTILRQATVYGLSPKMRFDLTVNSMVRDIYKTGRVRIFHPGTFWRPFVEVHDTSRVFADMAEADASNVAGEVFNVGSDDQNLKKFELAERICKALHRDFDYEMADNEDKRNYHVSFQKLRRFGFTPSHTPEGSASEIMDALESGKLDPDDERWMTVRWYKKNLAAMFP